MASSAICDLPERAPPRKMNFPELLMSTHLPIERLDIQSVPRYPGSVSSPRPTFPPKTAVVNCWTWLYVTVAGQPRIFTGFPDCTLKILPPHSDSRRLKDSAVQKVLNAYDFDFLTMCTPSQERVPLGTSDMNQADAFTNPKAARKS